MFVELVTKIQDGTAFTKAVRSSPFELTGSLTDWVAEPSTFGPCHSPLAGQGFEVLSVRRVRDSSKVNSYSLSPSEHDSIVLDCLEAFSGSVLISVAHYVPNAAHAGHAPLNAVASILEVRKFAQFLTRKKKSFAFLVVVNDIKVDGPSRSSLYDDYVLPQEISDCFFELDSALGVNCRVIVVSEAKLVEKITREGKRHRKKVDSGKIDNTERLAWERILGRNGDHAAKCVRGFARLPALIPELGFSSFLQIMPKCGSFNSHQGYELGSKIFREVPSCLLYRTHKCW